MVDIDKLEEGDECIINVPVRNSYGIPLTVVGKCGNKIRLRHPNGQTAFYDPMDLDYSKSPRPIKDSRLINWLRN